MQSYYNTSRVWLANRLTYNNGQPLLVFELNVFKFICLYVLGLFRLNRRSDFICKSSLPVNTNLSRDINYKHSYKTSRHTGKLFYGLLYSICYNIQTAREYGIRNVTTTKHDWTSRNIITIRTRVYNVCTN